MRNVTYLVGYHVQDPMLTILAGGSQGGTTGDDWPMKASGIGLLFSGGYLTQAGAPVLNCPSRNKYQATQYRDAWGWDHEAPFITSGGIYMGTFAGKGRKEWAGYWKIAHLNGDIWRGSGRENNADNAKGSDVIWGAYMMRDAKESGESDISFNMEHWAGRAMAADAMTVFNDDNVSGSAANPLSQQLAMNHEHFWNVMFTDAAVKGFSDSAHNISRLLIRIWAGNYPAYPLDYETANISPRRSRAA